jgi:[ribosomal protein S18]-alanine N-acetyltransferase
MLIVLLRLRDKQVDNRLQSAFSWLRQFGTVEKREWEYVIRYNPALRSLNSRYNGRVSVTIRDFQPADFDTLWRIDQTCFPAGISYSRAELRIYMRRRGAFTLVATNTASIAKSGSVSGKDKIHSLPMDGEICGFLVGEAGARARGHIITIDVIAATRGQGIGSLLLRAAEDRLISDGCRIVELETAVDNISALSFYKRHNYSVIKTFPRYYSNGVDALVLEKTLI